MNEESNQAPDDDDFLVVTCEAEGGEEISPCVRLGQNVCQGRGNERIGP